MSECCTNTKIFFRDPNRPRFSTSRLCGVPFPPPPSFLPFSKNWGRVKVLDQWEPGAQSQQPQLAGPPQALLATFYFFPLQIFGHNILEWRGLGASELFSGIFRPLSNNTVHRECLWKWTKFSSQAFLPPPQLNPSPPFQATLSPLFLLLHFIVSHFLTGPTSKIRHVTFNLD